MEPDGRYYRWTYEEAQAALALRTRGLSYPAIAVVMELYHGCPPMDGHMVRVRLRHRGAEPKPRGVPNINGLTAQMLNA